jgi:RimJ/RimL family protein N-acetyltransferase
MTITDLRPTGPAAPDGPDLDERPPRGPGSGGTRPGGPGLGGPGFEGTGLDGSGLDGSGLGGPGSGIRALGGAAVDRDLVAELVRRCSAASLRSRFFLPAGWPVETVLARYLPFLLAGPPDGLALAALAGGRPVGVLNLAAAAPGGVFELGVLVADGWQRRGVAGTLLRRALSPGRWPGRTVQATVQPGNAAARALVRSHGARLLSAARGEYTFALTVP